MKARTLCTASLACLGALLMLSGARADTVAEFTTGIGRPGVDFYWGQSFTTVTAVPESNIAFNFFSDAPGTMPYALGTGFLLSTEYLGTPSGLTSATPGFLGQATAAGGFYTFNPSLTLLPATQYFFYENEQDMFAALTAGAGYAGGHAYISTGGNFSSTAAAGFSLNFRVTGTPAAAPDSSSTWALMLLGLMATWGLKQLVRTPA